MNGLAKESAEELAGYSLHMADSGTDNFDRDFALSLLSSDQDAIYEIEEALKRIEKGTYGVCELTGKSIPKARLDAIPWTRFSAEAERDLEASNAVDRARIGERRDLIGSSESLDDDEEEPEPEVGEHRVRDRKVGFGRVDVAGRQPPRDPPVQVRCLLARPVAVFVALAGSREVDNAEKAFMSWFGPDCV